MGSTGKKNDIATNARAIENMNEAQIDNEIKNIKVLITRLDKTMNKNDAYNSEENKAIREAFPVGVGGDGWSKQRIKARNKSIERDVKRASVYTETYEQKESAKKRLETLEDVKKQISGTGKTQKQLNEERIQKAIKNTTITLKWKTTQKGGWNNGAYSPKIIKAGNIEIHGSNGLYTIYQNGKRLGSTDKLSKAKAYAEKIKK